MDMNCRCSRIVKEGFEELALALGGMAANCEVPDEVIWDLARAIDLIHERIRAKLSRTGGIPELENCPESGCRHPAIAHLLQRLDTGRSGVRSDGRE